MNFNDQNVLFQKLGASWYAFTEINGEGHYAPIPQGIDPVSQKVEIFQVLEKKQFIKISPEQAA